MFDKSVATVEGLFAELFLEQRPESLSYDAMTDRIEKFEVFESMVAAAKCIELATYRDTFTDDELGFLGNELGLALHVSADQAGAMVHEAAEIVTDFPPILAALAAGRITQRHAKVIRQVLARMVFTRSEAEKQSEDYALLLEKAALIAARGCDYAQTHTPAETRRILKSWIIANDPVSAHARHEQALSQRNVTHQVLDDGIGVLSVSGPVEQTYRIHQALTATARYNAQNALPGDERSIAQHRADCFLDVMADAINPARPADDFLYPDTRLISVEQPWPYLVGMSLQESRIIYDAEPIWWQEACDNETLDDCNPAFDLDLPEDLGPANSWLDDFPIQRGNDIAGRFCVRGDAPYQVAVTTDLETLLGLAENPMILDGFIPITAEHGRRLFDQADFQRLILDRDSGELIDKSPLTYTPNRATADYIRARDPICRIPGCTKPATHCEIDHEEPFNHANPTAGGLTLRTNLGVLCKREHQLKTHHGFTIETDPDATKRWVTPHQRRYKIEPHDLRPTMQSPDEIYALESQAIMNQRVQRMSQGAN